MTSHTFIAYLQGHARRTDGRSVDFVEDARVLIGLGKFPTSDSWDALEWHMMLRHADPAAIEAARAVHRRYVRWRAFRTLEAIR